MQTITLNIADHAVDEVKALLNDMNGVKIVLSTPDTISDAEKSLIDERLDNIEKNGFQGRDYKKVLSDIRQEHHAADV